MKYLKYFESSKNNDESKKSIIENLIDNLNQMEQSDFFYHPECVDIESYNKIIFRGKRTKQPLGSWLWRVDDEVVYVVITSGVKDSDISTTEDDDSIIIPSSIKPIIDNLGRKATLLIGFYDTTKNPPVNNKSLFRENSLIQEFYKVVKKFQQAQEKQFSTKEYQEKALDNNIDYWQYLEKEVGLHQDFNFLKKAKRVSII